MQLPAHFGSISIHVLHRGQRIELTLAEDNVSGNWHFVQVGESIFAIESASDSSMLLRLDRNAFCKFSANCDFDVLLADNHRTTRDVFLDLDQ